MYNGTSYHNLDEKGRLAVPSRFRTEDGSGSLMLVSAKNHLEVYPLSNWEETANKLTALPQLSPKVKALQRHFIGGAASCEGDRQGRILLPPASRQILTGSEVAVVGMGRYFEIWSKEVWLEEQARIMDDMDNLGTAVADLGI
jgi:MraZ protein